MTFGERLTFSPSTLQSLQRIWGTSVPFFCACRAGRSEAARFFCIGGAMQVYTGGAVFCLREGSVVQVQRLRR